MTLGKILRRILPLSRRSFLHYEASSTAISRTILTAAGESRSLPYKCSYARYFSSSHPEAIELDNVTYERVCSETLESLCDYFEELVENADHLKAADVSYGSGVLTVNLGGQYGTYVINRQSPNKQIWLSSPTSGPKRYDFVVHTPPDKGRWIYKHTGESLHELLQREIKIIMRHDVDFYKLPYSKTI